MAAPALPLLGNLKPEALLPVVVQPQLVPGPVYSPPFTVSVCGLSNPVVGRFLRGRGRS